MPCLNEEAYLQDTCASLGFGIGHGTPSDASLVIVDNGSTDSTANVAKQIRSNSPENSVIVTTEPERGFVPARHHGNLVVHTLARSVGWDLENVLILQIDADCHYSADYIVEMRRKMEAYGSNVMIEGCLYHSEDFKAHYADYVRICDETDAEFEKLFPRDLSNDVIVVDAVTGYRLSDYFNWGSHRREFNAQGEEIYSETTRLFMKARTHGAQRSRVESVRAFHSPRKALNEPSLHFATAGFPREESWNVSWQKFHRGPNNLEDLCAESNHSEMLNAIRVREEHLLALFGVLPLHVNRVLDHLPAGGSEPHKLAQRILPLLPPRTADELASHPGLFISDVLELIATHGADLLDQARQLISN
jgi:glycosyltransferase involved in cell wall biosynthesis